MYISNAVFDEALSARVGLTDLVKSFELGENVENLYSGYQSRPLLQFVDENTLDATPLSNSFERHRVTTGGSGVIFKVFKYDNSSAVSLTGLVGEGKRGGYLSHEIYEREYSYKTWGFDNKVTFEAQMASEGLAMSAVDKAAKQTYELARIEEEKKIIGGNRHAIGAVESITSTVVEDAGLLEAGDIAIKVVPLTYSGLERSKVLRKVSLTFTRNDAGNTTTKIMGGYGKVSAEFTATATAGSAIKVVIKDVEKAYGYAIFAGKAGEALTIQAILDTNVYTIKSLVAGDQNVTELGTTDQSEEFLDFDGLLAQTVDAEGLVISKDGEPLTFNGYNIEEFDLVDNYFEERKLKWTKIVFSGTMRQRIANGIVNRNIKDTVVSLDRALNVGSVLGKGYLSTISGEEVEFVKDQYVGPNKIICLAEEVNEAIPGIYYNQVMVMQDEYTQIKFPSLTRTFEMGTFARGVLMCHVPQGCVFIKNIG